MAHEIHYNAKGAKGGGTERPVQTHVIMEGLGLTGVFTCVSSLWSCTVQVPENTITERQSKRRMVTKKKKH